MCRQWQVTSAKVVLETSSYVYNDSMADSNVGTPFGLMTMQIEQWSLTFGLYASPHFFKPLTKGKFFDQHLSTCFQMDTVVYQYIEDSLFMLFGHTQIQTYIQTSVTTGTTTTATNTFSSITYCMEIKLVPCLKV